MTHDPVGAGLPAKALVVAMYGWGLLSLASQLLRGLWAPGCCDRTIIVGAGLPAKASVVVLYGWGLLSLASQLLQVCGRPDVVTEP